MNKNLVIGTLVVVALVGFGLYLSKRPAQVSYVDNSQNSTPTPTPDQTPPAVTTTTPPTPDAPTVETSSENSSSNSAAAVTGRVKPNGASTSYWYEYGKTSALGARTTSQVLGSGYSFLSAPGYITGLSANTLYYYRLSAKNSFSTVNGATYTFTTGNNPPPPGAIPSAHTGGASSITRTSAAVSGTVNPNGNSTYYWFEYGKDTNFGFVTSILAVNGTTGTVPVSIGVIGLDPLTKYYFRVNAQNSYGTVIGNTSSFTTSGPGNPSAPTVNTTQESNVNTTSVQFNGRINPNGAETTCWFEYSTDSVLGTLIGNGTAHQTIAASNNTSSVKFTQTGLSGNTSYYYRLVAQNAGGYVRGDIESFKTK